MKWSQTQPSNTVLDIASTMQFCRVDDADESTLISDMISAAVDFAESSMGASLLTRTVTAIFYDGDKFYLPHGPVQSITSVTDVHGNAVAYSLEGYGYSDYLNVSPAKPSMPITVVYQAGYGDTADTIPAKYRAAIKQHVLTQYDNRSSIGDKALMPVPHGLADFYELGRRNPGVG